MEAKMILRILSALLSISMLVVFIWTLLDDSQQIQYLQLKGFALFAMYAYGGNKEFNRFKMLKFFNQKLNKKY